MNVLDELFLTVINGFAQRSWAFDTFVSVLAVNHLLKGGVFMALFWGKWFQENRSDQKAIGARRVLLASLVGTGCMLFVARLLAAVLPFRVRPFENPALLFRPPYGLIPAAWRPWSAFPSDHATVFFGLATGLSLLSPRLGLFGFAYAFVVCLPRIYLGLHYPTDIVAGGILGIAGVLLANLPGIRDIVTRPLPHWLARYPGFFYTVFFALTFELATMFNSVRALTEFVAAVLKRHLA